MNKIHTTDILTLMKLTILAYLICCAILAPVAAHANEAETPSGDNIATAIKNSASDVDLATRKAIRWTKKQGRKVVGEDSSAKRAEDNADDARDEAKNEARKAENRAKQ